MEKFRFEKSLENSEDRLGGNHAKSTQNTYNMHEHHVDRLSSGG
jgi:hypothetical protein